MSTTCRIVPATLPEPAARRTPLKTSVSLFETLFLVPSSWGRVHRGGRGAARERGGAMGQARAGIMAPSTGPMSHPAGYNRLHVTSCRYDLGARGREEGARARGGRAG